MCGHLQAWLDNLEAMISKVDENIKIVINLITDQNIITVMITIVSITISDIASEFFIVMTKNKIITNAIITPSSHYQHPKYHHYCGAMYSIKLMAEFFWSNKKSTLGPHQNCIGK